MKNLLKKYPTIVLIVGLGVLFFTQQKVVMPLVYEVIKSDFFLVESNDKASQLPISTHLTELAFNHCNTYIQKELDSAVKASFPVKPINAWSLGNYQYVINAEVTLTPENSTPNIHKYACRITFNNGDNQEGANDFNNWTVEGVSGLDKM